MLEEIFNNLPHLLMVLNSERQLIFSNPSLLDFLSLKDYQEILGDRPGEIFKCVHAWENPGGCGTSLNCQYCGAAQALKRAQETKLIAEHECRLSHNADGKIITNYFKVIVYPHNMKNLDFYLFYIEDLSSLKHKEQLEKAFYHDLNNLLTMLQGNIEIFSTNGLTAEQEENFNVINNISNRLIEEIQIQKDLSNVLVNQYSRGYETFFSLPFLLECENLVKFSFARKKVILKRDKSSSNIELSTDKVLLRRTILNLLKNAYEECKMKDIIQIRCFNQDNDVIFWVQSPTLISQSIKNNLFEYGVSTKGKGRGIGLYSSKLFVEQILRGNLSYDSNTEEGTVFRIHIPSYLEK
ncbi:hypothetical protein NEF87_000425 [Candidatus Lokiarchaeum ossiferum]|uniref:Histidine kinase domain-containing protein n=1 Tax=Candidatus Lokiarchaeum ossiferum TaxID=2951803 RepID=A0ABY6HKT5_9ARCH|nr:hypothetical protein NEF87_000425 [Candidatus Lokiarchaeum sp. B-35]